MDSANNKTTFLIVRLRVLGFDLFGSSVRVLASVAHSK